MSGEPVVPVARPGRRRALAVALLGSCHPLPTAAVTLVSTVLGAGVGLRWWQVLLLGAAVLAGQLSIGWSNDAVDAARDLRAGRADKPLARGALTPQSVRAAAAGAVVLAVVLSLLLGAGAGLALLTLVACGWAYNLGLKATVLSGAAYALGFAALPLAPYLVRDGRLPAWWVPVTGALLGLAAHFANVLPDLRVDAETGVRGLPQRLGARRGVAVMALSLAAASIVLGVGPAGHSRTFAVAAASTGVLAAVVAVLVAHRRPETPAAFRITMAIAVLDVAMVVWIST